MNKELCDKYYMAQTKEEARELGLKVAHFCALQKGHEGHHVCFGGVAHRPEEGGTHITPLNFELGNVSMPSSYDVLTSKAVR